MHEVSIDQMSWERAGQSYSQIWEGWTVMAPTPQPVEAQDTSFEGNTGETAIEINTSQSTEGATMWHYTKGESEQSPISFDELKHLFSLGELTGEEEVWTDGMSEWRNARDVPALADVIVSKRPRRIPATNAMSGEQVVQQPQPIVIQNDGMNQNQIEPEKKTGSSWAAAIIVLLIIFGISIFLIVKGESMKKDALRDAFNAGYNGSSYP
jgi:hypothetical protein